MKFRLAILPLLAICLAAARPADRLISINVRDADALDVIRLLAAQSGINIMTAGPVRTERITMYLRGVPFDRVLRTVLQTQHLESHADGSMLVIRTKVAMAGAIFHGPVVRGVDAAVPSSRIISLHFLKPSDALERLARIFPDPSYVADDEANTLSVTGTARMQNRVKALVAALDVGNRQVAFDVQILGVAPQGSDRNIAGQTSPAYIVVRNSGDVAAWWNALMQRGLTQMLAGSQVFTLDNRQAEVVIRQTFPEVFADPTVGQQVEFVRFGVTLQMTPSTDADGSVRTRLHADYSAVAGFSEGYPVFGNRSIGGTLRVGCGQTIVFGGALGDIDSGVLTKVPALLGDPVFGKVFRQGIRTHRNDAIVFLITPRNTGSRPQTGKLQLCVPVSHRR